MEVLTPRNGRSHNLTSERCVLAFSSQRRVNASPCLGSEASVV